MATREVPYHELLAELNEQLEKALDSFGPDSGKVLEIKHDITVMNDIAGCYEPDYIIFHFGQRPPKDSVDMHYNYCLKGRTFHALDMSKSHCDESNIIHVYVVGHRN